MASLRKMFPMGQLPDKFKHGETVVEVPLTPGEHPEQQLRHAVEQVYAFKTQKESSKAREFQTLLDQFAELKRRAVVLQGICPDCGGEAFIDDDVQVVLQGTDEREESRRDARVAFCSTCEFAMEMPEVQS